MKKLSLLIFSFLLINSLSAQTVDSIIDIRDSQIYKVVKIGQQWWMQENLNIGTRIDGPQDASDNGIIEKYCYGDNTNNCNIYGGLYQWNEMMDYNTSDDGNPGITQGICPLGWHLPTDGEWSELTDFLGGETIAGGKLKETGTTHWASPNFGATNASGFNALPGGYCSSSFYNLGSTTLFRSSTEYGAANAWSRQLYYNNAKVDRLTDYGKNGGFSVRCLRDADEFGHLTITNKNLKTLEKLIFINNSFIDTIIIINSNPVKTINITSIYTGSVAYNMTKSSAVLSSGDSIHLKITFNSLVDGMYYFDTLNIESDDPYNPVIQVLLKGYKPKTDSIVDIRDQQVYKIVKIGQQWWMQENLNIGTPINGTLDAGNDKKIEKYCQNDDLNNCKIYGGLYQWNEMMDYTFSDNANPGIIRGICPAGWHLPTDAEWKELEMYLGLNQAEADADGVRGTDEGGKLKETGTLHWNSPNTGATNESGFTALPGGNRQDNGLFYLGFTAYFWSTTESYDGFAWNRDLYYVRSSLERYVYTPHFHGNSVRCLRDSDRFSYLTISDDNFNPVSDLKFYSYINSEEIIIINSGTGKTINISSINTSNSAFSLNNTSSFLSPGDSIHLNIVFNPPVKGNYYFDSLIIESDDPYKPVINISLEGYEPKTDSIIDIRDNQVYKIVKIGQQWWMQENLNIGTRLNGSQDDTDNGIIEKYCFGNSAINCKIYGGLYRWDEMMNYNPSDNGDPGITRGVCPAGWHLPTNIEWTEMTYCLGDESVAGGKLKETGTIHWDSRNTGATNESGFTALGGGFLYYDGFFNMGYWGTFYSSTESGGFSAWYWQLASDYSGVGHNQGYSKEIGFSVRCLMDSDQFGYLTIFHENLDSLSTLNFYGKNTRDELIILNSCAGKTINITSIHTKNSAFELNYSSAVLESGDSIHLTVVFNPLTKGIYLDSLYVESDDPYNSLKTIPLKGIYASESCGVITQNSTWTRANSPYLVKCNLTIAQAATLTIEPGVTLIVDSMKRITVDGVLIANGTAGDTIVFTNYFDNTFEQVYIRSTGTCKLSCFKIEGALTALKAENDSLIISNGIIRNCIDGINNSTNTYLMLENLCIKNNSGYGIITSSLSNGLIKNCVIQSNLNGIYNSGGAFNILGNTIQSNKNYGIYYSGVPSGYNIKDNLINNNGMGLLATNGSITDNIINFNKEYGVELNGAVTFDFNKVQNNYGDGVRGSGFTLKFNQIDNNTFNGVTGSNFEINSNKITANGLNGILSSGLNTIENNIICYNIQDGINDNSNSTVRFNNILYNGDDGIQTSALPVINNNNIYGNEEYNVHATKQSNETVNAEYNYWGVTGSTEIQNSIFEYYDDGMTVIVDFDPYLNEEIVSSSYFDFAKNITVCFGEKIPDLIATGNDIKWYSDAQLTNLVFVGDTFSTGNTEIGINTYYVTQKLTDSLVLKDTSSLIISSIPIINGVQKTNETNCNSDDGTITITASDSNPLLYSINGGDTFFNNNGIFTGLSNGIYPVIVVNSNGCEKPGGEVEIISNGIIPPAPDAGKDTSYCFGDEIKSLYAIATTGGVLTWYSDPGLKNILGTGPSFTPSGLKQITTFYITETDNDCESPAKTVTLGISNIIPYENEQICVITTDSLLGKNLIIWEKTPGKGTAYYNIYRESKLIGTVGYEDLSILKDNEANPKQRPYLYKLSVIDTCGNESALSPFHKPIFLQFVSSVNGVNLTWSKYEIEGENLNFDSYCIYRGSDSTSLSILEENIPIEINVYTDNDPNALTRKYYYRVAGVLTNPCYPTGSLRKKDEPGPYNRSISNIEDNRILVGGLKDIKTERLSIYPNPFSESTILTFNNPEGQSYTLYILDLSGKVCRIVDNINTSRYVLDKEGLKAGFYFIELRGEKLYRERIIIE